MGPVPVARGCRVNRADHIAALEADGATVLRTASTIVLVLPQVRDVDVGDELVPIATAAKIAATSTRVVKDAIRGAELPAFGGQRDRSVRRADLTRWIESRRSKPVVVGVDADLQARMRRLAKGAAR